MFNIKPRIQKLCDGTWQCARDGLRGYGKTASEAYWELIRLERLHHGLRGKTVYPNEWWRQPNNWWDYQVLCSVRQ